MDFYPLLLYTINISNGFQLFRFSNELLGLEGMVKIKNPDENLLNGNHTHTISIGDTDVKISTNDITDSKRFAFIDLVITQNVKKYQFWILIETDR